MNPYCSVLPWTTCCSFPLIWAPFWEERMRKGWERWDKERCEVFQVKTKWNFQPRYILLEETSSLNSKDNKAPVIKLLFFLLQVWPAAKERQLSFRLDTGKITYHVNAALKWLSQRYSGNSFYEGLGNIHFPREKLILRHPEVFSTEKFTMLLYTDSRIFFLLWLPSGRIQAEALFTCSNMWLCM